MKKIRNSLLLKFWLQSLLRGLIICLIAFTPSYSIGGEQEKDSLATTKEITTREIYDDVKIALTQLAEGLQVGSEHVYGVLVKQQVVEAWAWVGMGIMSVMFLIVFAIIINRLINKQKTGDDSNDFLIGFSIIASIILAVVAFTSIVHIDTILTGFINPEYGAIKEILDLIK